MVTSTEETHKQRQFWSAYVKEEYPISKLPVIDMGLNEARQWNKIQCSVEQQVVQQLQQYCNDSEFLWYCFLQAALQVTLYKYDGEVQVMTASPLQAHNEQVSLWLPIKYSVNPAATFKAHVLELRERLATLYAGESLFAKLAPNEHLWSDTPRAGHPGIIVTMEGMHNVPDVHVQHEDTPSDCVSIHFQRNANMLYISYNYPSTITKQTIQQFDANYQELLTQALMDTDTIIRDLSICSLEQKQQILYTFNAPINKREENGQLVDHFVQQVSAYPQHVAVAYGEHKLTYTELNNKANLLADILRTEHLLQPEQLIAVRMPKGIEYIVSILAILKVGCAYVPIDIEYPADRVQYLLEDSQVAMLLVDDATDDDRYNVTTVTVADKLHHLYTGADIKVISQPDALAYALYTSGTTGKPKGVLIKQQGILNLVKDTDYLDLNHDIVMLQASAIIFDMSTLEIWGTLLNGGTLVIADKADLLAPAQLQSLLYEHRVNTMFITTALFHHLAGHHAEMFAGIKQLLTGGEVLSPVMSSRILNMYPNLRLVNAYGPTECTVMATTYNIKAEDQQRIPIGKPLKGTRVLILNADGQLQPVGVPGELCIGGVGVGRSYLNRPDLTADRFVPDLHDPDRLMYKTGDIACWNENGNVLFMGRGDRQIKLRGYRIEPGEIENALLQHPAVREAVVVPIAAEQMETSLYAFVVCSTQLPSLNIALAEHLRHVVPAYMIPAVYVQVDQIPLKSSGKVDTARLQESGLLQMQVQHQNDAIVDVPQTEEEKRMCEIWASVLDIPQMGLHQNFFESGGHSLKLVMLAEQLQQAGYTLNAMDIYKYPTVATFLQFQQR